jgi:hypothetical protein
LADAAQHLSLERISRPQAPQAPSEHPLFRPAVFASRRRRHFGHVLDHRPLPFWWMLGPILGVVVLYILLTSTLRPSRHEVTTSSLSHPRPAMGISDP